MTREQWDGTAPRGATPKLGKLSRNIAATMAGQGSVAAIQILMVPLYVKILGIESYGLIGFFAMLQSTLQIVDFGLSPTMNRELARYSTTGDPGSEARDFVRTLEIGYWALGLVLAFAITVGSPLIADLWIRPVLTPVSTVQSAVLFMGIATAFQWPISFYVGGLMGLERHPFVNAVKVGVSVVGAVGALLLLRLVSPRIDLFFAWQAGVSAIHVLLLTLALWRWLPRSDHRPRFDWKLLRNVRSFAAGMTGITLSAVALTQSGNLVLSAVLSLESFGYYMLAAAVGGSLALFINPVYSAVFARLSSLVAAGDEGALQRVYHWASQLLTVLLAPTAAVMAIFSFELLFLWTGTTEAATRSASICTLLVVGTALNGIMHMPFALQLAHGWTNLGLRINIVFVVTLVPATIVLASRYGPVGGAAVWVVLNAVYALVGIPLTHQRLLRGEMGRWFRGILPPAVVATVAVGVVRFLVPAAATRSAALFNLIAAGLPAVLGAVLVARDVRSSLSGARRERG